MRVSEYYNLGRTQPSLDFVDVDIFGDSKVFVDPYALRLLPSSWGDVCVFLIQNFFRRVLELIKEGHHQDARILLAVLREPNETHLGLSRERARGRALGSGSARDVWQALSQSEAVASGLLEDLEDAILMVEGISSDIISDITTNIIRDPLVEYTESMCEYYGIPLQIDVNSGPLWDPTGQHWYSEFVRLPVTGWGKLLLVPKVIVRRRMEYDVDEYYGDYILEHLRDVELSANSELVRLLRDGRRRVTKKDLKAKYGRGKATVVRETRRHPELLQRYRRDKRVGYRPPMDHVDIAEAEGTPNPDWDALLRVVTELPTGRDTASAYEKGIEALLTAIFYPCLTNPQVQLELHEGRKRVDITYTNVATDGFFRWLSQHYSAPHIFVECKNYNGDPGNPELDQLSGRFSPSRGQTGILVCRTLANKELFIQRCRDTADDQRGFIIPLDDDDLISIVDERRDVLHIPQFRFLQERFDRLIM